jgi:FlaA1/EpsC-like NDP-sugar epimerase
MKHRTARNGQASLRLKIALDLAVWTAAAVMAFGLRVSKWTDLSSLPQYVLAGIPLKLGLIVGFGLHRQVWRRVTVEDLERILPAVASGTILMFLAGLVWHAQGTDFPRTVPLIEGTLALLAMGGIRVLARLWAQGQSRQLATDARRRPVRVLLVGAGNEGTRIGREIRRDPTARMELVGFLDDDPVKAHLTIAGSRLLGTVEDLPSVAHDHLIDEVLITMPAASGKATRRVVELARKASVDCRILPGITQVLSGDAQLAGVRRVQVDDLLRREPVEMELPSSYIVGHTVLVTGAGGSIGSELVRKVARLQPGKLVLFGHGENTLHEIQRELDTLLPELNFTVVVGDIRDRSKLAHVMGKHQPEVVFHAAAHKHVSLMEGDPDEAVLNNVAGTRNLAEAALIAGVKRFVNVSTDKAVHPASMLGVTKSLAERVVRMVAVQAGPDQVFASVRFGNVLGSRGSVVPIFQEQIRRGGPLTITDPDVARYFMTIPEACHLVIQAGGLGENGAVYILNMGTPVRIIDLARDMINLAGADEDEIQIVISGLRRGEKLHEELFSDEEELDATTYDQIMVARHEPSMGEDADIYIDTLITAAERRDWEEIDRCIKVLAPGYYVAGDPVGSGPGEPP